MKKICLSVLVCAIAGLSCMAIAQDAQAEGKLREWLQQKRMERKGGGEAQQGAGDISGLLDDSRQNASTCAERSAQVSRLINGRLSAKVKGPEPDKKDVSYGPHALQKIDVFLPKGQDTSVLAPVIIMVHGGGWCVGDKSMKGVTANKVSRWTPKGFVVISANYPMVSDGSMAVAQAEDVARAIAYVQKNAHEWGGDGKRVILMGHSAGAHLVSLVNADADIRNKIGVAPVLGAISLDSGATNVPVQMTNPNAVKGLKMRYLEAFGSDEANWIASSPHHQLGETASPWLGVCSSTRPDDPCGQAEEYAKKSISMGIDAYSMPLPKNHGSINSELGEPGEYTEDVEAFMATLDPIVAKFLGE